MPPQCLLQDHLYVCSFLACQLQCCPDNLWWIALHQTWSQLCQEYSFGPSRFGTGQGLWLVVFECFVRSSRFFENAV